MDDKELRILFLRTKLENESKNLDSDSFFNLLKDNIGWAKYNQIYAEYANNSLLDSYSHTKLTELGKKTLKELELEHAQQIKDENVERKKLHNESKLSEWQIKTFWPLFIFGLFGGLYSTYDIMMTLTKVEDSKEQVTKSEMESELSKLRTLILIHKKDTVVDHSNVEQGN